MDKILCKINLGTLNQTLWIEKENKNGKIDLKEFSLRLDEIPTFISKEREIKDIYITGASKSFLEKIESDTRKIEQNLYAENTKLFHYM